LIVFSKYKFQKSRSAVSAAIQRQPQALSITIPGYRPGHVAYHQFFSSSISLISCVAGGCTADTQSDWIAAAKE
jgi:hypothetical protein